MITDRRIGRFHISLALLMDSGELIRQEIFSRVTIVRAETMWDRKAIEYVAICEDFEEVPIGDIAPEYFAQFRHTLIEATEETPQRIESKFEKWVRVVPMSKSMEEVLKRVNDNLKEETDK